MKNNGHSEPQLLQCSFPLGLSEQLVLQTNLFAITALLYLLTLLGNMATIIWAGLDPRLHTPMHIFLTQLSLVDLCYTSSTVLQLLVNLKGPEKMITYGGCVGQLYVSLAMGSICRPLHYTILMHPRVCWQLVATTWLTGLGSSLVQTVLITQVPLCVRNIIDHVFCEVPILLKLGCVAITFNWMNFFWSVHFYSGCPSLSFLFPTAALLKHCGRSGPLKIVERPWEHALPIWWWCFSSMALLWPRICSPLRPLPGTRTSSLYGTVTPTLNPFIYTLCNKDIKGALRKVIGNE